MDDDGWMYCRFYVVMWCTLFHVSICFTYFSLLCVLICVSPDCKTHFPLETIKLKLEIKYSSTFYMNKPEHSRYAEIWPSAAFCQQLYYTWVLWILRNGIYYALFVMLVTLAAYEILTVLLSVHSFIQHIQFVQSVPWGFNAPSVYTSSTNSGLITSNLNHPHNLPKEDTGMHKIS